MGLAQQQWKQSSKIKELDRSYTACGDMGKLTLDSNKQDGKRCAWESLRENQRS